MALIEAGKHSGTLVEASILEATSGAVMFQARVDIEGTVLRGGICLIQKDGTLSERGFKDVQQILGWTAWDWAAFDREPETFAGHAVECVVETVEGERGAFSAIKYLNPPGGGGERLAKADAKGLAAKYGAKTRALFGGTTAKPMPPKPPVAPPKPPPAPVQSRGVSTMEECWEVFCKLNANKTELELYGLWAKQIEAAVNKSQNDCTPEDWAEVKWSIENF